MSYGSTTKEQGTPEVAEKYPEIYQYILQEEANFKTNRVPLSSNWRDWNMYEHVDRSFTLKNSRFYQGTQDYTRPFDNIILPIASVNYRMEGFDVKDVNIFVDDQENYHKSFMARKFHKWWAKENHIDTAIDESVESYFDYGLMLLKNVNEARPEVVDLHNDIAFVDQTDVISGPICLKHQYSISELLEMKGNWYEKEIDKAVIFSKFEKNKEDQNTNTPGKYVEVYELHGTFPESWLGKEKLGEDWEDTGKYSPQVHIVTYHTSPTEGGRKGICLFKGKEPKPIFKALKRDDIKGRACGRGGIEELFHPQIWTNFSQLHIHQMLEAVSKVLLVTTDKKLKNQKLSNMKHGQIIDLQDNTRLEQLVIQPINKAAFDNAVDRWAMVAQKIGSATDAALSQTPASGVPLGTVEILAAQGFGIHEYRQGKIADFWSEVYRDWGLAHFATEINKGSKWLDDLTLAELQEVAEKVSTKQANERIKRMILAGKMVTNEEADQFRAVIKETFMKGGEKRFLEVIKDELKDLPTDVEIDIKGKNTNLVETVTKLNAVFRSVFTPAGMQVLQSSPAAGELLNEILEKSGLKTINFGIPSPIQQNQLQAPRGDTSQAPALTTNV